MVGFIYGGGARKENFHFENLSLFEDEHEAAFGKGSKVDKQGYPDSGNGRYAKKFTYREWFDFNSNQRHHLNFLESIFPYSILILVAGLKHPQISAYCGFGFIVARIMQINGPTKFAA